MIRWTLDQECALIEEVSMAECLYNPMHVDFSKRNKKWWYYSLIANKLNKYYPHKCGTAITSSECCKKWKNIRSYYSQIKTKQIQSKLGSASLQPSWSHFKRLDFLNDKMDSTISRSNIELPVETKQVTHSKVEMDLENYSAKYEESISKQLQDSPIGCSNNGSTITISISNSTCTEQLDEHSIESSKPSTSLEKLNEAGSANTPDDFVIINDTFTPIRGPLLPLQESQLFGGRSSHFEQCDSLQVGSSQVVCTTPERSTASTPVPKINESQITTYDASMIEYKGMTETCGLLHDADKNLTTHAKQPQNCPYINSIILLTTDLIGSLKTKKEKLEAHTQIYNVLLKIANDYNVC